MRIDSCSESVRPPVFLFPGPTRTSHRADRPARGLPLGGKAAGLDKR